MKQECPDDQSYEFNRGQWHWLTSGSVWDCKLVELFVKKKKLIYFLGFKTPEAFTQGSG